MDLNKNGKLLRDLRKAKGMTQKQVADRLGVLPKAVSKWERGRGFPDVSIVSELADVLGVSERILLSGDLVRNSEETGNMKKIKFYVCPHCGSFSQSTGENQVICCGEILEPLKAKTHDAEHSVEASEVEDDFYITFDHEMSKEHFISFVSYVACDRVLTVKLYPEQDSAVRFPKMYGGRLYYHCNRHGLFVCPQINSPRSKTESKKSLTALTSAFARAYHFENNKNPVFCDTLAKRLFSTEEYAMMEKYIQLGGKDVKEYVDMQLSPVPLGRAAFCEDCLKTAVYTGTEQYVILGCGFDTFALRNPELKLKIFEIDKPEIIADKINRIKRAGVNIPENDRFISADLSSGGLERILAENGFDKGKKTFFSCLGLTYYLSKEQIEEMIKNISEFAADGSSLIFDFADDHFFSSDIPRVKELIKLADESGEPMRSCFGYGELERFLEKYNFLIYEFLNDKDMQERYFNCSKDGASAFEHIDYVLAVLKR